MTTARPVALVTGAAGGLGSSLCTELRTAGYLVVGLDIVASPAADESVEVDLSDLAQVRSVATALSEKHGVSGVVHNAAVQPLGGVGEVPLDDWLTALRVNLLAVEVLVAACRDSLAAERGAVVVVSSIHARTTTAGMVAYATTKAALEGWVRAAALDLAPHVRVNAVAPGAFDSPKLREGLQRWGADEARDRLERLRSRTPLERIAAPAEVARTVCTLLGPGASFVTGATLVVDGGVGARLASE